MIKVSMSLIVAVLLIGAPVLAFDKGDKTGSKGGPKLTGSGMAMSKDGGDKGDKGGEKGGGKKRMSTTMHKDGGDKGDKGEKGGGKKSMGLALGKDSGEKGGKDGGKKGLVGPSDGQVMKGQQGLAPAQMDRGMDRGNAGMERGLDGMSR